MNTVTIILLLIIAVLLVALAVALATRPKVVTLYDNVEASQSNRIAVMKLQNELAPYVSRNGSDCYIKVVKP